MTVNTGDTAWILISSALVMLMTPGLALFYGGMARRRESAVYHYDELCRTGGCRCAVGAVRLQLELRH